MEEFYNYFSEPKEYKLNNKDVEVCGEYFDIVPDGNLYTLDDYPIFAIRMRPAGIWHIMSIYKKKYNIKTTVLTYKINRNQYTLYSSDSKQMYEEQKEALVKFFDFSLCKEGEFKGVIIVVVNKDNRMIHAIPYVYGIVEGRKKIIFLDAFFSPDIGSGCVIGADFFYRLYEGQIDCFCHGDNIQADHHSCGIIACDFVKHCLKDRASLSKKIIKNYVSRKVVDNYSNSTQSMVYIFDLPAELKKFSQFSKEKTQHAFIGESATEQEKHNRSIWCAKHTNRLLFRHDTEPYNPNGSLIPDGQGQEKDINTSLLEKGHKYADMIIKDLGQQSDYNYKYWISLVRGQNARGNIFRRLMRFTRNFLKTHTSD